MNKKTNQTLTSVLKECLIQEGKVEIPKVGRLEVYHEKQRQMQRADGQVVLHPPQDKIRYKPLK